jgi:hypothetical protein
MSGRAVILADHFIAHVECLSFLRFDMNASVAQEVQLNEARKEQIYKGFRRSMGACRSIASMLRVRRERATIAVNYAETLLFTQTLFGHAQKRIPPSAIKNATTKK